MCIDENRKYDCLKWLKQSVIKMQQQNLYKLTNGQKYLSEAKETACYLQNRK